VNGTLEERRPGVWRLRVYLGRGPDGRVLNASRTIKGTKSYAQKQLRAFVDEVDRTRTPDRNATVGALLDRWLDHIDGDRSPSTMREHRRSIEKNIKPALGDIRLDRLTAEHLDRTYRAWQTRGLAASSVRRQHAILGAALHQAVKWGWVDRAATDRATPPSAVRAAPTAAIGVAELRQLLEAAEGDDPVLATAIALAALTGCRRGELCALRWSDVDLDRRVLTVARAVNVIDRIPVDGPTKTHQVRRLSLDPVAVAVLERRRADQERLSDRAMSPLVADPWILSRRADGAQQCLPDGLTHGFARLQVDAGITVGGKARYRFHDLRHFSATTAIAAGVDIRSVAGRLGHADASTTLRIYAHAVEVADQAAAAALGRALQPGT
jgi:integrase